ncbi:MAG: hypothetical protein EOM66_01650 [Clostridia bacterium]|nr:hypothetical protein [Clostridia bacterium]
MKKFKMRWPELGLEVTCNGIAANGAALDTLLANLPIKTIQGHEMVGGWMLRDRSVHLKKQPFAIAPSDLSEEAMQDAPVGRISLLFPQGSNTEVLAKYDACVDTRTYVPIAQVQDSDLDVLKKVGKLQWKSATRTKEVYVVEFLEVE